MDRKTNQESGGVAADGVADKVGERQGEGSVLAEGRTLSVPEGHGTEPRRPWNRTEGNVLSPAPSMV